MFGFEHTNSLLFLNIQKYITQFVDHNIATIQVLIFKLLKSDHTLPHFHTTAAIT